MKVFTNIKTLKQVKRLLNDIGLGEVLDGGKIKFDGKKLINSLLDEDKLVEFLRLITRDEKTDFEEMEASEVGGLIDSFLGGIGGFLPAFLRAQITAQYAPTTSS